MLWFAASGVVGTVLGLATSELARRLGSTALRPSVPGLVLAVLAAVDVAAVAAFALVGSLWLAFAMVWLRVVVWSVGQPIRDAWLSRHLEPAFRATVLSISSQANSVGQATGGPALGWVGSTISIRVALLASALVASPTVALYRRLDRRGGGPVALP